MNNDSVAALIQRCTTPELRRAVIAGLESGMTVRECLLLINAVRR